MPVGLGAGHRRKRRLLPGFLLPLLILAGVLAAHARFAETPFWTVRALQVEGNRSISTQELLERCHLHPGMPWWRVSRQFVTRLLQDNARLCAIHLAWVWPRDLRVTVTERGSVLRLVGDREYEVATDGILLEPQEALDPADLPLLTGEFPADLAPGRTLEPAGAGAAWHELLEFGQENPSLWREISEIHYEGDRRFQLFLREGHKVVLWQSGVNHALKQQLPRILADLGRQGLEDAVIDLRFQGQAVVRLPEGVLEEETPGNQTGAAGAKPAGQTPAVATAAHAGTSVGRAADPKAHLTRRSPSPRPAPSKINHGGTRARRKGRRG
jgi:cell division septal protein FtsQ